MDLAYRRVKTLLELKHGNRRRKTKNGIELTSRKRKSLLEFKHGISKRKSKT